jgi:predicted nucleotidyltransferase
MALDLPLDRIADLCRGYGVVELDVFGSVARGEATDGSDIDFLYVLSDPSIGMRFFEFQRRLADLLGRDVDQVDLVPKQYLNRVIRDRVLAEARPVYAAA